LLTLLVAFIISEFIYFSGNFSYESWLIKSPKSELWIIIGTQLIVAMLLIYWFLIADRQSMSSASKMAAFALRILFVFPVFFLIYFLGIKRYTLKELGILNLRRWYVSLPILVLIGGVSYLLFPDGLQFEDIIEEHGYLSLITLGFLTAAIPEEITRNLLQSRLGRVLKSKSLGWFLSSLIWALIHIPLFSFNTGDYYLAFISALGILPIGLFWGYLNQRYRSIIPSIILHGTNLWGLHNLF
jgi:membrane protease YdiL (CAAX protease family)